jgi:hypothetical protein
LRFYRNGIARYVSASTTEGSPMKKFSPLLLATAIAAVMLMPTGAPANVGSANFSGIVNHVSTNNIKITDNRSHQTMSFLILPKFNQVFSSDGKTTYQMSAIHAGQYVKVYYDQRMLGARHADRILLLTQYNAVKRTE